MLFIHYCLLVILFSFSFKTGLYTMHLARKLSHRVLMMNNTNWRKLVWCLSFSLVSKSPEDDVCGSIYSITS